MARDSDYKQRKDQFLILQEKLAQKFKSVFGVSNSAMRNRLRAKIIYEFFKTRDGINCFRCGEPVDRKDYSIDHGESFWDAVDPLESFYDVSKCFLSHFKCNTRHGLKEGQRRKAAIKQKRKALKEAFGGDADE